MPEWLFGYWLTVYLVLEADKVIPFSLQDNSFLFVFCFLHKWIMHGKTRMHWENTLGQFCLHDDYNKTWQDGREWAERGQSRIRKQKWIIGPFKLAGQVTHSDSHA